MGQQHSNYTITQTISYSKASASSDITYNGFVHRIMPKIGLNARVIYLASDSDAGSGTYTTDDFSYYFGESLVVYARIKNTHSTHSIAISINDGNYNYSFDIPAGGMWSTTEFNTVFNVSDASGDLITDTSKNISKIEVRGNHSDGSSIDYFLALSQ